MNRRLGLSFIVLLSVSTHQSFADGKSDAVVKLIGRAAKLSSKGKTAYTHLRKSILEAPNNPRIVASHPADDKLLYAFTRDEKGIGGGYRSMTLAEDGAASQFDFKVLDKNISDNAIYKNTQVTHNAEEGKVTFVREYDHKLNKDMKFTETQEIQPLDVNGRDFRQVTSHSVHTKSDTMDKVATVEISNEGKVIVSVHDRKHNDLWAGVVELKPGTKPVDMRISPSGESVVVVDSTGLEARFQIHRETFDQGKGTLSAELRKADKISKEAFAEYAANVKTLNPRVPAGEGARGVQLNATK